jgi:hypothetical protein
VVRAGSSRGRALTNANDGGLQYVKECELKRHLLAVGVACDEDDCIFWDHLGLGAGEPHAQCAVKHFNLLGTHGNEIADWLLRLMDRADAAEALNLPRMRPAAPDEPRDPSNG